MSESGIASATRSRRSYARRATVAAAVLLSLVVGGGLVWSAVTSRDDSPAAKPTAATTAVMKGTLQGEIIAAGTFAYADRVPIVAGRDGVLTELAAIGSTIDRGGVLSRVDNLPTFLMFGALPAWRSYEADMGSGPDVRQLEENLAALGFFSDAPDENFRWATTQAIRAWQKATGQEQTGTISLGIITFRSGPQRVASTEAKVGDRVGSTQGVATASSLDKRISIQLNPADVSQIDVGGTASVQLPDGTQAVGVVERIDPPTTAKGADGADKTIVPVTVSLADAAATANIDNVSVTATLFGKKHEGVYYVPVTSLIGLDGNKIGVQLVQKDGSITELPVKTGVRATGNIEISGDGVREGLTIISGAS
ncbi:peptidoglycan-binding protein [Microbacterium sp. NPDC087589]|uniref:peptidoglycan-binding protein n=1 Tax=Microbacterium sp. NPDC087589 TaxID=3364191 RepID=UPI0037F6586F